MVKGMVGGLVNKFGWVLTLVLGRGCFAGRLHRFLVSVLHPVLATKECSYGPCACC